MSSMAIVWAEDDIFFKALENADPESYAITCSKCGTYAVGNFKDLDPEKAICPSCGHDSGCFESPALCGGRQLLTVIEGDEPTVRRDGE